MTAFASGRNLRPIEMIRRRHMLSVLLLLAAPAAGLDLAGSARLEAMPGSVHEVSATESLPVQKLGPAVSTPVAAQTILVELDLGKLQRRLDSAQREIREIRALRRERRSSGDVRPPGGLN